MNRITRRAFLRLSATAGLLAAAPLAPPFAERALDLRYEPYRLVVDRLEIRSARVPSELDGFTIGQLTDIHSGPNVDEAYIARAARILMGLSPDLIALTGDFVQRGWPASAAARALRALRAPHGVYGVLGNHDIGRSEAEAEQAFGQWLAPESFAMLRNSRRALQIGDTPLHIVGVDDVWMKRHDLPRALAGMPRGEPAVLLAHEPDFADQASAAHPFILQLSGHSHGGQIRLPRVGALVLPELAKKYPIGLAQAGGMPVYTSRGVGMISPHMRINCPPEITLLTLRTL
jgi:predicted MPP superfamily phosphohydrolase